MDKRIAHLAARAVEEGVAPCLLCLEVAAVVVRQAAVRRLQTAQILLTLFGSWVMPVSQVAPALCATVSGPLKPGLAALL